MVGTVLILVLMEVSLKLYNIEDQRHQGPRFNPCSNGSVSQIMVVAIKPIWVSMF